MRTLELAQTPLTFGIHIWNPLFSFSELDIILIAKKLPKCFETLK